LFYSGPRYLSLTAEEKQNFNKAVLKERRKRAVQPGNLEKEEMEQLKRASIEELLEMTAQEGAAYMKTLSPEEQEKVGNEIHREISRRTSQAMVDSLNSIPISKLHPPPSKEELMSKRFVIFLINSSPEEKRKFYKGPLYRSFSAKEKESFAISVFKEQGNQIAATLVEGLNNIPKPEGG
jgi:hypothetical protein